jgi:hypothetical protein
VGRRLAVRYFYLQAAAIALWWAGMLFVPGVRTLFFPADVTPRSIGAFLPGDVGIVVASLVVASSNQRRWAVPLAWIVAGAMAYATLMTTVHWMLGSSTWLSAMLMVPATIASVAAAAALTRHADDPVSPGAIA